MCRRPEFREHRRRWGCDGDTAEPWDYIECISCEAKSPAREACLACSGTGQLPLTRCPWVYAGAKERFVCDHAMFLEAGLLPQGGGWGDLPVSLQTAWRIVASERASITRQKHARANQQS